MKLKVLLLLLLLLTGCIDNTSSYLRGYWYRRISTTESQYVMFGTSRTMTTVTIDERQKKGVSGSYERTGTQLKLYYDTGKEESFEIESIDDNRMVLRNSEETRLYVKVDKKEFSQETDVKFTEKR